MKNKEIMSQKEIEAIKVNYEQGINNIDETYTELANENDKYVTQGQIKELVKAQILEVYPIGSIYISENNTNPGTFLGGTWEAYGQGRTLIGAGSGTDANGTTKEFVEKTTGGEYTHKLTVAEMPSHTHPIQYATIWDGIKSSGWEIGTNSGSRVDKTSAVGGSGSHNNIQPYIVTYMWKRIK